MSYPVGAGLTALFNFTKNGVLTNPSPLPTIVNATYPNTSLLSPFPALTPIRTGQFFAIVFTAGQVTATGPYQAFAYTTDATMDNYTSQADWEVQVTSSGSVDVVSFSGAAATQIDDIQTQVDLIGDGTLFTPVPVGTDGLTTITRGSSYYNNVGLALTYTLSGYPALTVGVGNAIWRGTGVRNVGLVQITGDTLSATQVRFELAATDTINLESGGYSIQAVVGGTPRVLKTPNDSLVVLDSN